MSLYLYLVRHAQATDTQTSQQDFERELTAQGQRDSVSLGQHLKKINAQIDFMISSKAKRAEATACRIAEAIDFSLDQIHYDEEIYQASARILLQLINAVEVNFKSLMIVGHNPYLSYLAEFLSKSEIGDMHTGSVACIKFDLDRWSDLAEGNGSLEYYFVPALEE